MYEMKEEYLTGIKMIDDAYTRMFDLAEEIYQLLHDDSEDDGVEDKFDELAEMIGQLKDLAGKSFAEEEEYLKSIAYKKIFTQMIEHKECIERLEGFVLSEADENREEKIDEMLKCTTEWLAGHIRDVDVMIGK